jgi:hypothetical protein
MYVCVSTFVGSVSLWPGRMIAVRSIEIDRERRPEA